MKKIKQSISICLILMLLSAFAMTVVADANPITPIDTAKEATLTVQFHTTNNQPIENAVFKLWKVGEVTKAGAFRINEPYLSVYNPEDEWKNVVLQMLQKAEQENIEPLLTATTDSNGVAAFQSTDDVKLRAGLYIVDGGLKRGNQYAFKATPFIVRLPNFVGENHDGVNDDEDVWNYDVIAVPKEYTVSLYTVYYNDNRQSIGNREVTQMPQPSFEQFDIGNSRLFTAPHSSDPLEPYVRRSGAGDTDKNRYRLLYAEPQAEGYEFVGWNKDNTATEGFQTMDFEPSTWDYNVYAIWEPVNAPSESTTSDVESPGVESPVVESPGVESPGVESPGVESPGVESPGVESPSVESPGTASPGEDTSRGSSKEPSSSNDDGGTQPKKDPILPQTGMLWWPVPVLAILGFAAFIVGVFYGRRKRDDVRNVRMRSGILLIVGVVMVSSALALVLYNGWDDMRAGNDTAAERARIVRIIPGPDEKDTSAQTRNDNGASVTKMPVKRIDGTDFSAMLSIPSLSLELPVRDMWSYPGLRRSPCRYAGSAYTDDLVICGHNYTAHFGNLKRLAAGDELTLTAMNGDVFRYRVAEVTELSPAAYEEMIHSAYDLTLFTCTIGGGSRVTVRCAMTSFTPHDRNVITSEYALF